MQRLSAAFTIGLAMMISAACSSSSHSSSTPATNPAPSTSSSVVVPRSNTVWLCRPGTANDPCTSPEDTTVRAADGSSTAEQAVVAPDPPIDCFYVYPTVSAQTTPLATLHVDPEEKAVAVNQASRFSQVCRVFAPMYRQATIAAITGGASSKGPKIPIDAGYQDVVTAWRDYLAHDNNGRGVVLIGHSQGSGVLIRLVKSEIDGNADVRARLVSALLLGGNVTVPTGRDVGGDFQHIPVCTSATQNGCVVAYSTFLDAPPAGSLFGRPGTGPRAGRAAGKNLQVVCVNPAAPAGGSAALHPYFTTTKFPGPLGAVSGTSPSAPTPWVAYPDRYTARCQTANGATWLQVTPSTNPGDTRPTVTQTLGPTWGLHLYDVNIALGDLIALVRQEAAAHH